MNRTKSAVCERIDRLLSEVDSAPKLLKSHPIRGAVLRYIGRHGLKHAIEVRDERGRKELRYVTDAELAVLGLVAP